VEGVAPIVTQVLRTAGQHAVMDAATARRLADEAQRLCGERLETAVDTDAVAAVSRILPRLGDLLPELARALKQPPGMPPPPPVQEMILALSEELGFGDYATAEDVLAFLTGRPESGSR
jgi:hypothetical protein